MKGGKYITGLRSDGLVFIILFSSLGEKLFICENSSPVINKHLTVKLKKTDARVRLEWRSNGSGVALPRPLSPTSQLHNMKQQGFKKKKQQQQNNPILLPSQLSLFKKIIALFDSRSHSSRFARWCHPSAEPHPPSSGVLQVAGPGSWSSGPGGPCHSGSAHLTYTLSLALSLSLVPSPWLH